MALLMLGFSVMLTALVAWALGGRGVTYRVQPVPVVTSIPALQAAPMSPAVSRPSPRIPVQTSAALLAIALALDVSGAPQAQAASLEPDGVYSALTDDAYLLPEAAAEAWTPVELAPDWAVRAINTTDGWLI